MATEKKQAETVERKIGSCQICERDQKLSSRDVLVNHGYQRPGYGHIVGNCPGVSELPYERSCEAIKGYKGRTESYLAERRAYLGRLESGEVRGFTEHSPWTRTSTDYAVGVTPVYEWESKIRNRIAEAKSIVAQLVREIARCEARIAGWKLLPIRTVLESKEEKPALHRGAMVEWTEGGETVRAMVYNARARGGKVLVEHKGRIVRVHKGRIIRVVRESIVVVR